MEHHLNVDIETFSDVPIGKAGLYRYAQSPAFQILLFAYSLDGGPVQVVDLARGETIPREISEALFSPQVIKHAYNAAFEWYCLSRHFCLDMPAEWLPQWRCTMIHALYCAYPAGLDATGKALGLSEETRKMAEGKALIRYFCVPCTPSRSNGERTRNLPDHDPARWELFKRYNARDVMAEMEIERRLSGFPVPAEVQKQWVTDQIINSRGVAVDAELVDGALAINLAGNARSREEAARLTGLENPNSVSQLTAWVEQETGKPLQDLRKDTVADLLRTDVSPEVRRVLEIRQELGKTSNKKYSTLASATCADGRVRGLLQFYGAARTGRWAGRFVQPQNLPQTHIDPELLPLARELTREKHTEGLRWIFGSVPDTLSQLIRTALIAGPDCMLVDADFSAIEARLIAWLAGEEWVLEVFRTHGKIYEAAAAQMFGVPIDSIRKGAPEYAYRQKGKVATLALGYQGGVPALIAMGALRMGISEEELPDIVSRWRESNPNIVRFWGNVEAAAWEAVNTGRRVELNGGRLVFQREFDQYNDFLTIQLPCRRKLYYPHPHMGTNRFGRPALCYWGVGSNNKWGVIETYGGKLTENITQAVARDCLAEALERLEAAGYPVVFHVHDEVVADVPKGSETDLQKMITLMRQVPDWAPDLPLNTDGWISPFFKKD